ncbi:MFS transporter [Granulicella cerasi]|uniref:MFS transporter n=1 Tax=Granulicella cerasi TaxID=741063 RepID=A0ABW1Z9W1_9BACT|nr:MFS transporter [Granulicella cerasi]
MHLADDSRAPQADTPGWPFAVASGILGWILDAFDFFILVFLFPELMARYGVSKGAILWTMTMTLAMRPVGALIFGAVADKLGRKWPLIVCVAYFSTVTVCSGLAPTYGLFMLCRCLYGIGMGGYWGIGASYAMESAPRAKRGMLSGLMQAGYPLGYLLAALAMQFITPRFGWHAMFYCGTVLAAVIIALTLFAPESDAWEQTKMPSMGHIFRALVSYRTRFLYLLILMAGMTSLSHGTQDLYPDFLRTLPFMQGVTVLGMKASLGIAVLYNLAAIVGALIFGQLSQRIGRRYGVMAALCLCLISMHWWAFGASVMAITLGAMLMQAGTQGAFGVIPAHLNELSPSAIRGLFAGFTYQLGVLLTSPVSPLQNFLREHFGYSWALASFELVTISVLFLLMIFGPENHSRDFHEAM